MGYMYKMNTIYVGGRGLSGGRAPLLLQKGLGNTYDGLDTFNKHQGRMEGGGAGEKRNVKRELLDKLEGLTLNRKPKNIKFTVDK